MSNLTDGRSSEKKTITANPKFGREFTFINTAAIIMLCNMTPIAKDVSYGMRRRARIVPFNRIFDESEADESLFPTIWRTEMSGVLNMAIAGLQRLRQRGRFLDPVDCQRAKEAFLAEAHPLAEFVRDVCKPVPGAWGPPKSVLYARYREWAIQKGIRNITTEGKFGKELRALGYPVEGARDVARVVGLALRDSDNNDPFNDDGPPHNDNAPSSVQRGSAPAATMSPQDIEAEFSHLF